MTVIVMDDESERRKEKELRIPYNQPGWSVLRQTEWRWR